MAVEHYYINTVQNEIYRDLDVGDSKMFFAPYMSEIKRYTVNHCVGNDIGDTYCYFTIRDKSNFPVAFFSKSAKKQNAVSVCSYTQCTAWNYQNELFHNDFGDILRFGFLLEEELDDFAAGSSAIEPGKGGDNLMLRDRRTVSVDREAIRAIMYRVMMRWMMGESQIKIAVPAKERERYNGYILNAVDEIYSYFPSAMRSEAGFASFLPKADFRDSKRIYLVFVPEEEADALTVFLDGSTPGVYRSLTNVNGLLPGIKSFIDYVVTLENPDERRQFLDTVFKEKNIENNGQNANISPMRYKEYGRALSILNATGSAEGQLPVWEEFASKGLADLPEMENLIWEKIDSKLTSELVEKYLTQKINGTESAEEIIRIYGNTLPLFAKKPALKATLWNILSEAVDSAKQSDEEVYSAILKHKAELELISEPGTAEMLTRYSTRYAEIIVNDAEKEISGIKETSEDLKTYRDKVYALVAQERKKASRLLPDVELDRIEQSILSSAYDYIVSTVSGRIDQLDRSAKTPDEIQALIRKLREQMKNLEPVWAETDSFERLTQRVERETTLLQEKLQQSGSILFSLKKKIDDEANYFSAIESVSEEIEYLSEADRQALFAYLISRRPADYRSYCEEFRNRYMMPLTISGIAEKPFLAQRRIVSDCKDLLVNQTMEIQGETTEQIIDSIHKIQHTADQFSIGRRLKYSLFGREIDELLLGKILTFSLNKEDADEDEVKDIIRSLADQGVAKGCHITKIRDMYEVCGYKQFSLFREVAEGVFQDTNEETYMRFFREMAESYAIRKRTDLGEALDYFEDRSVEFDWDPKAKKAFRKIDVPKTIKTVEKPSQEGIGKIIVIAVLSFILLAFAVLNVLQLVDRSKKSGEIQAAVSTISEIRGELDDKELALEEKETILNEKETAIREMEITLNEAQTELQRIQEELNKVQTDPETIQGEEETDY